MGGGVFCPYLFLDPPPQVLRLFPRTTCVVCSCLSYCFAPSLQNTDIALADTQLYTCSFTWPFSEVNLPIVKPYANFLKISGVNNVFGEFKPPYLLCHYLICARLHWVAPPPKAFQCCTHTRNHFSLHSLKMLWESRNGVCVCVCVCVWWSCPLVPLVNGTTGESLSLTIEERKLLAEEWIKQAKGK